MKNCNYYGHPKQDFLYCRDAIEKENIKNVRLISRNAFLVFLGLAVTCMFEEVLGLGSLLYFTFSAILLLFNLILYFYAAKK